MDKTALLNKVQNLDEKGLKNLLSELKLYQDLKKKLGNRWEEIFDRKHSWEKLLVVEHFSSVTEDMAWEHAKSVYKKAFELDVLREKIKFISKDALKWGIKVYLDDSMVDLSFSKIEKSIKK